MRIIGIDPGYDRLGIAVLEKVNGQEKVIFSDCILTDKKTNLDERLFVLGKEFKTILDSYNPDRVAIETLFFNQNIKTAIGVAQARGIIMYLAKEAGCDVVEFGPQEIKIAVTGYGKSDKSAVIEMVKRLVPTAPGSGVDDEYDAIAVAITALAHYRE